MNKRLLAAGLALVLLMAASTTLANPAAAHHDPWAGVIQCESSGDPTQVTGPYSGLFQFDQPTWNGVASRHYPHLTGVWPGSASVSDQYAMAWALHSERGTQPWPYCGRFFNPPHSPQEILAEKVRAYEAAVAHRDHLDATWRTTEAAADAADLYLHSVHTANLAVDMFLYATAMSG